MSLPNYQPEGTILFGSVPWNDSYRHVRLYGSLDEQYNDITSMMRRSSSNYVYIGRNRRLKVDIEADKLYHMNYCMYRNDSLTDGYIYCFITDVEYVNDHTSEITLETDIFQTYMFGVDWTIPPCFIERETVPSESPKYLLTQEPDFNLVYEVTDQEETLFTPGGVVIMTSMMPHQNSNLIEDILNPMGWYASPGSISYYKGVAMGAGYYYIPYVHDGTHVVTERIETILNGLTSAGAIDAVASVFVIPSFESRGSEGWIETPQMQDAHLTARSSTLTIPDNEYSGYTPSNSKLSYYPYSYVKLTDFNGSTSELRYELLDSDKIDIKYSVNPSCKALVSVRSYMGVEDNLEAGIVTTCGAQCSWNNDAYQSWLGRSSLSLELGAAAAGVALAGLTGGSSLSLAATNLGEAAALDAAGYSAMGGIAMREAGKNVAKWGGKAALGAGAYAANQFASNYKQPTVMRGSAESDLMWMSGEQGVRVQRIQVRSEIAEQIDQFFKQFGYAVERVEPINITSRPYWNYVKTSASTPKSTNVNSGNEAPFTRGRGTPAGVLSVIQKCFDNGITFWHTTSGFGDMSLDNSL